MGSSGVGKSSLINQMLEEDIIKTQNIRKKDDRGRHTTTIRQLTLLPNERFIIDTPGLRSIGISHRSNTINELFPEIGELERLCEFGDCSHMSEPNCGVQEALKTGELDYDRYMRYLKLRGDEQKRKILSSSKEYKKRSLIKKMKNRNR